MQVFRPELLISSTFVWWYCGIIVLFALVNAGFLWWQTQSLSQDLKALTNKLGPLDSESKFAQSFDDYDKNATKYLKVAWTEFKETLIIASGEPVRNVADATLYLNSATIIDSRIKTRWYKAVPNLLTGLGILGTFAGLAAGVHLAGEGLASGLRAEINEALQSLLGGASLAFLTSIAGIFSSLLFLVLERWRLPRLPESLDTWVMELEDRLERVDIERIGLETKQVISGIEGQASRMITRLAELASEAVARQHLGVTTQQLGITEKQLEQSEEAANQLKRFNDDLIFSIEAALEDKIGNRLAPSLEKLVTAVEGLRTDQSHDSREMIQNVVRDFTDALHERTGSEMDGMAAVLKGLKNTLGDSTERMAATQRGLSVALTHQIDATSSAMDANTTAMTDALAASLDQAKATVAELSGQVAAQFEESNKAAAEHMHASLETSTQALAAAGSEAASRISASWELLETSSKRLERSTQQSGRMLDAMSGFVTRFDTLQTAIRTTHRSIVDLVHPMEQAAGQIRVSSDRTRDSVTKAEAAVTNLVVQQREIQAAWTDYRRRFEGLDLSLTNVFEQLQAGLGNYLAQVKKFATVLDSETARSISLLSGATGELKETVGFLAEYDGLNKGVQVTGGSEESSAVAGLLWVERVLLPFSRVAVLLHRRRRTAIEMVHF